MHRYVVLFAALLAWATLVPAVGRAADDRALYEAAKAEGQVVWYTTLIINVGVRPLVAAFQKKYPGTKVEMQNRDTAAAVGW